MDSCRCLLRCSCDRRADLPADDIRKNTESTGFHEVVTDSVQESDQVVQSANRAVNAAGSLRDQGKLA